jgi:hypothetical protein
MARSVIFISLPLLGGLVGQTPSFQGACLDRAFQIVAPLPWALSARCGEQVFGLVETKTIAKSSPWPTKGAQTPLRPGAIELTGFLLLKRRLHNYFQIPNTPVMTCLR